MYSYTWDSETGGILLNTTPLSFCKEPRPVYYKELDLLGFDRYWIYAKDDSFPYMWAEANNYFYRGKLVAKTKGGNLNQAPKIELIEDPEPKGQALKFIDIAKMIEKNRDIIEKLAADTVKMIYNTYIKYKKRIDVFYVAFSGGKDSIVTLDLVQRALPHNEFKVLFGDTGMEFPDTYKTVDAIEKLCLENGIEFIRAKSQFDPQDTWLKFGPPATVTRWCCSVHKTAPQILVLREKTGKANFTGMAFIGVRASESLARSEYDYISLGEKHKGQYSCNPILDWNSAELYLYIYAENLYLNEAYRKGNRRVGCLLCPRAAERNEYMCKACYPDQLKPYTDTIKFLYKRSFDDENRLIDFIGKGGWKARKNGRDISIDVNYSELMVNNKPSIKVVKPQTDWKVWIRTIGVLSNDSSPYHIIFRNNLYSFEVFEQGDEILVQYTQDLAKEDPLFIKLLKSVFRKAACCIRCRECEADCHNGCISMKDGTLSISDKCIHCAQCHSVEKGCLVYKSLEMPKGELKMTMNKSLNCYSHHAPKMDWIVQFFKYKDDFDSQHTLGSQMYSFFKRFLRDAELLEKNSFSDFARLIEKLGLNNQSSWGLMLINLAYTPQINWLIKRVSIGESVNKEYTKSLLITDGAKESWVNDVWSSFTRILALPFNEVGLGTPERGKKDTLISITRNSWLNPDPLVILYGLYKFAEACQGYYQFTLTRLQDFTIDSDGVSPSEIFGLDRDLMEKLLTGLSINYPEFIDVSFTLNLDNITLNGDKTSKDVLNLF